MVGSFRDSVNRWLTTSLQADIYVASAAPVAAGGPTVAIPPSLRERYDALPDVAATSTNRTVVVRSERGPVDVAALDVLFHRYAAAVYVDGTPEDTWTAFRDEGGVVIPEPLAYRLQKKVGDSLSLDTVASCAFSTPERWKRNFPNRTRVWQVCVSRSHEAVGASPAYLLPKRSAILVGFWSLS